jgi:hypothetical protein
MSDSPFTKDIYNSRGTSMNLSPSTVPLNQILTPEQNIMGIPGAPGYMNVNVKIDNVYGTDASDINRGLGQTLYNLTSH